MTETVVTLSISTAVLLVFATVMTWYSFSLLRKLWALSSNIKEAEYVVSNFREHVRAVYELETFYGDPTLQNLLEHAQSVEDILGSYDDMFSYYESDETIEETEEEGEEDAA